MADNSGLPSDEGLASDFRLGLTTRTAKNLFRGTSDVENVYGIHKAEQLAPGSEWDIRGRRWLITEAEAFPYPRKTREEEPAAPRVRLALLELATGLEAAGEFPWDGESDPTGFVQSPEPVGASRWRGYQGRDLEYKKFTASGVGWHWFGITEHPEDPRQLYATLHLQADVPRADISGVPMRAWLYVPFRSRAAAE